MGNGQNTYASIPRRQQHQQPQTRQHHQSPQQRAHWVQQNATSLPNPTHLNAAVYNGWNPQTHQSSRTAIHTQKTTQINGVPPPPGL